MVSFNTVGLTAIKAAAAGVGEEREGKKKKLNTVNGKLNVTQANCVTIQHLQVFSSGQTVPW